MKTILKISLCIFFVMQFSSFAQIRFKPPKTKPTIITKPQAETTASNTAATLTNSPTATATAGNKDNLAPITPDSGNTL